MATSNQHGRLPVNVRPWLWEDLYFILAYRLCVPNFMKIQEMQFHGCHIRWRWWVFPQMCKRLPKYTILNIPVGTFGSFNEFWGMIQPSKMWFTCQENSKDCRPNKALVLRPEKKIKWLKDAKIHLYKQTSVGGKNEKWWFSSLSAWIICCNTSYGPAQLSRMKQERWGRLDICSVFSPIS